GLAINPAAVAVRVVFLFPDREAVFYLVDDEAACGEGFGAMGGRGAGPYGDVADGEFADTMDAVGPGEAETVDGFLDDARAFLESHGFVGFIIEAVDGLASVVIAHPALEGDESAGGGIGEFGAEGVRRDG